MNTKIIYISGDKIHNPADVRAAFDEIRMALGLSADTILFGVPVEEQTVVSRQSSVVSNVEADIIHPEPVVMEEPKPKKTRAKKVIVADEPENQQSEKIIPILSVLSGKQDEATESIVEPVATVDVILDDEPTPVSAAEKTLEELLENLAPLKEDASDEITFTEATVDIIADVPQPEPVDVDETLSKLATEFAEAQDILDSTDDEPAFAQAADKPAKGSISKLKNILPFKKQKTDTGGIMGDLFGWAGIAANDDDGFAMPGFFKVNSNQ